MSEMAQTADHVVVLGRGRVLANAPITEILTGATAQRVTVARLPHNSWPRRSPARM